VEWREIMSSSFLKIVLIVAALFLLSACGPATATPTTEPPMGPCPPEYLVQPELTTPAEWAIVDSLTPALSWVFPPVVYPFASSTDTCIPEGYNIELSTGPFYTDNLGGATSGSTNTFTPYNDLEPGKTYRWGVQGISYGVLGPFEGYRYFFTGDACDPAAFVAAELLSPADHEMVSELNPTLTWNYPDDCLPPGYRIDLSTESAFADTSLAGGTGNPDTRWGPGDTLEDCTQYYWMVRAVSTDGTILGPASPTFTFYTNTGECAAPAGHETSIGIGGFVWEDLCAVPELGPLPDPLPAGCISAPGGGVTGDGIRTPGEPGLMDVMVRLGSGPCPSTNMGVTFTDSRGIYTFNNLPAGTYCVSIDSLESTSVLVPGGWTSPATDGSLAQGALNLAETEVGHVHFGWRYQFGPSVEFSVLNGVVWDDECGQTNLVNPTSLQEGCVADSSGTVTADGVRQADESGIYDVWVKIYKGTCGSSTPPVFYTVDYPDTEGSYEFFLPKYQANADYCLMIDAEDEFSEIALMPGIWTLPDTPHLQAVYNINFSTPQTFTKDFGWDRLNRMLGPIGWPVFELDEDTFCYEGPSGAYRAVRRIPAYLQYYIEAIDPTGKWALIDPDTPINANENCIIDPQPPSLTHIDDDITWGEFGFYAPEVAGLERCGAVDPQLPYIDRALRCWIMLNIGRAEGQLGDLPRMTGPRIITPTPTPTPTPVPPYCSRYTTDTECFRDKARCYYDYDKKACLDLP
jgi:hypothetical protein